jgi:hypothetical protein
MLKKLEKGDRLYKKINIRQQEGWEVWGIFLKDIMKDKSTRKNQQYEVP